MDTKEDDTQRQHTKKPSCRECYKETDDGFVSCNDKHDTENDNIPR